MVLVNIRVNLFNLLKFIVLELLFSYVLGPAWELIISRTAHARIVRGERITLAFLPKVRTFPCTLTTGRLLGSVALFFSLLAFGGSLASEYAVDSRSVRVPSSDATAKVFSRNVGRKAKQNALSGISVGTITSVMTDRCCYRDETTVFRQRQLQ